MVRSLLLAVIVSVAMVSGCAHSGKPGEGVALAGGTHIQLSTADAGKTMKAKVGDALVFRAKENPSTGYIWTPLFDEKVVVVQSTEFIAGNTDPQIVGAPGERVISFLVVGAGASDLKLDLARPFDATNPAESHTFRVEATVE